jgi:two-component system, chemotaxis family, chemotaxis protein CheY
LQSARRVLLIDDDKGLLSVMALAFASAGYEVESAPDGEVGLALFHRRPAELVITDLIMPVREGVETIIALKRASPAVKIIAISGGFRAGPQDYLLLARHIGAETTLEKPFRIAELLNIAERLTACRPSPPPLPCEAHSAVQIAEAWDDAVVIARLVLARGLPPRGSD